MTTTTGPELDVQDYLRKVSSNTSKAATDSSRKTGSSLDKNQFMTLMVTQLKYQDPLNPSDNQQMAAQMAQFSSLEALQNMQTSMSELGKSITSSVEKQGATNQALSTTSATTLIGNTVRVKRSSLEHSGSASEIMVNATAGSELAIQDSSGKDVCTIPLDGTNDDGSKILDSNGDGAVTWNGKDQDGKPLLSGVYSLVVRDKSTGRGSGYAFDEGTVTGVGTDENGTVLRTAAGKFHLSDLLQAYGGSTAAGDLGTGASSVSLIGHTAKIRDNSASFSAAKGEATWKYTATAGSMAQVLDSSGNVVKSFSATSMAPGADGGRTFAWDGALADGTTAADGTYYLKIVSSDGKSYGGTTYREETIDSIGFDASGSPLLISGQKAWAWSQLFTVS
ncbi:MAG TPA: flagellar hook capping FlgD N-terminal domain-containing protein [Fibrobacteria bacterium]|nr:flagellar hook capping FlgD N-terminal domain-containing protein [Fibrobacteria bacterium]HOX50247.1 flagellar hook capping FlgD N-terminal domain-containing protein [Fibrobacteria bacterium]